MTREGKDIDKLMNIVTQNVHVEKIRENSLIVY